MPYTARIQSARRKEGLGPRLLLQVQSAALPECSVKPCGIAEKDQVSPEELRSFIGFVHPRDAFLIGGKACYSTIAIVQAFCGPNPVGVEVVSFISP